MIRSRIAQRVVGTAPFLPLFILFGLNAVDEFDRAAFGLLLPEIRDHFRLGIQGVLTLEALVGIVVLLVSVPLGHFADRSTRVRIAGVGASTWGFFSILTGLAPTLVIIAIARAGSGFGRAVVEPTHNSLLSDYYGIDVRTKVYAFHRSANYLGRCTGPLMAGVIAFYFGWRTPFVLFGVPTLLFVLLTLKLREPKRGVFERTAAGASAETAATQEVPPNFTEAARILWQVRSLRRIWFALPFFAASILGLTSLLSLYYDEVFGLDEVQRGFIFSGTEGAAVLGVLFGTPFATRIAMKDPGRLLRFLGAVSAVIASMFVLIAVAPRLYMAIAVHAAISGLGAILVPAIYAALSLAISPKVRSLGFSLGLVWLIPGLFALPIIGGIADDIGIRRGMLLLIPLYLMGATIISTAGKFMAADIRRVWTTAATQAEVRRSRLEGDAKMLVTRDIDVYYGKTQVLFSVNFDVSDGEIVALLGTNGAGKSTLLKAISGSVEPQAGAIIFDGRDITMTPPNETVAAGVIIVPGGKGVFPGLTIEENIKLAGWLYQRDPEHIANATDAALRYFPILRERWTQKAGNLSGGEQQMLTLAQALIAKPKLLMIDELSLGLAPLVVENLLQVVRAIHDAGTTVVLVEQSVNVALTLAKRAVFMEKGEIRFDGPTEALFERPDILRAVFLKGTGSLTEGEAGGAAGDGDGKPRVEVRGQEILEHDWDRHAIGPDILEVNDLSVSFGGIRAVNDVTFTVRQGQIMGIIGPNGAGKTTIFDLISGFLETDGGTIRIDGRDVTDRSPDYRARHGLGRSFQDARLFPSLTVLEALSVALERQHLSRDPLAAALGSPWSRAAEWEVQEKADQLIELMGLQAFSNKFVSELSTGSRRIVDLACYLAHEPRILLLDEPSSGIAQRETESLGPLLVDIRNKTGAALLVIEHDMPLITSISEEMIALDLGTIIAQGTPDEVIEHPAVVTSYLGTSEEVIQRSGQRRAVTT